MSAPSNKYTGIGLAIIGASIPFSIALWKSTSTWITVPALGGFAIIIIVIVMIMNPPD